MLRRLGLVFYFIGLLLVLAGVFNEIPLDEGLTFAGILCLLGFIFAGDPRRKR